MPLDRLNTGFLCFSPGRFICLGVSSAYLWVSCGDIFFLSESRIVADFTDDADFKLSL